jgi:hypothetical protein
MVGRKRTIERRENKRYKAIDEAYVGISPNPNSHKLGQIIDISMGGLSFKYSDDRAENKNLSEKSFFLSSTGYYVDDLPFKTISDYEVTDEPSFSSMKVRQKHVQFSDLNCKQLFDLDYYLRNNVSEPIEKLPKQYTS